MAAAHEGGGPGGGVTRGGGGGSSTPNKPPPGFPYGMAIPPPPGIAPPQLPAILNAAGIVGIGVGLPRPQQQHGIASYLPPNLLAMFQARPALPYAQPLEKRKMPPYTGVAQFVSHFEDPSAVDFSKFTKVESRDERKKRRQQEKLEKARSKIQEDMKSWDPFKQLRPEEAEQLTTDAYKTLFVARINYETSEAKLRREFGVYGPIIKLRMIFDKTSSKPRGYAFIEFEHERDMRTAYKQADGKKIDGRRVLVDVERGRTVRGWLPRRLGGGLGKTRAGGDDVNQKHSGREPPVSSSSSLLSSSSAPHDDHHGGGGGGGGRPPRDDFRDREEREKERERERERERARRDRDRDRERDREREREKEREHDRERRDRDRDHRH
eukprot:TRINITY_DN18517_c0_g1_i1.p1 TRINITY_DN18517_c0_g1~~TRINITY_DN18517_c0_g1_i1.p1  ORF type:complete len:406 (-),score=98.97 TRINITY_DN18517_c0_g1_i1:111-1253(-)